MKLIAVTLLVAMSLGCAMGQHKNEKPTLISLGTTLVSAKLVDLKKEDWLVYETMDPLKLNAIRELLLEAEPVDEAIAQQQQFGVQLRLSFGQGTSSSFMYGETTGDLRLGTVKSTQSFRLKNPERLNAVMRG